MCTIRVLVAFLSIWAPQLCFGCVEYFKFRIMRDSNVSPQSAPAFPTRLPPAIVWVAVKELVFDDYNKDTPSFTV